MKGHIRQRGRDTWQLFADLKRATGEPRKQITKTFHGTKREAAAELRKMLADVDGGLRHDASMETVDAVLNRWLNDVARLKVTPGTFERYKEIIDRILTPAIGSTKLANLTPSHLQALYARWSTTGQGAKARPMSPATVRKYHAVLRSALKMALKNNLVTKNVAALVDLPRLAQVARKYLTPEECWILMNASKGSRLSVPIRLMLETGMRRGELLGLHWIDVDLARRCLTICHSLERTRSHGFRIKEPKTGKSRTVSLSLDAVTLLAAHRETQQCERRTCTDKCETYNESDLVFPMPWGDPWDPAAFGRTFRRLAVRAGLGSIGPHTLRHTSTTLMLQHGLGPKVVADRLGHSTTRMTMDIYAHVTPMLEAQSASAVDAVLKAHAPAVSLVAAPENVPGRRIA